jgi:hypothetical protein
MFSTHPETEGEPPARPAPADPAAKRRAINSKYNLSAKGQARNQRYEDKHPERKLRWETARNTLERDSI